MMEKGKMERGVAELVDTESLIPQEHLLRKVDKGVGFRKLYEIVEPLYSEEDGRPSVDPEVLFKIVLQQHLDGIPSVRGTLRRAQTDIAYRWFLGYTLNEERPHFSTVSYNFRHRFTEETIEAVFQWVLNEAGAAGALSPAAAFIDGIHIKASANLNKKIKQDVPAAAKRYRDELLAEINADREAHGKKPFDDVYDKVAQTFPEIEAIVADSAYKTPHICKKVLMTAGYCPPPASAPKICAQCPTRRLCTHSKFGQEWVGRS